MNGTTTVTDIQNIRDRGSSLSLKMSTAIVTTSSISSGSHTGWTANMNSRKGLVR